MKHVTLFCAGLALVLGTWLFACSERPSDLVLTLLAAGLCLAYRRYVCDQE
jgi:hypothetical protein